MRVSMLCSAAVALITCTISHVHEVAQSSAAQHTRGTLAGDVVVYGSTPGAVMSAVAAARQGAQTILVDPAPRVGGMCSGGLGRTDRGNSVVIGGLAQEFFARNRAHYHHGLPIHDTPGTICLNDTDIECGFYLEPHVAEGIFLQMMQEAGVQHLRTNGSQVDHVAKEGTVLKSLTLQDGTTIGGKVFIAGTYEGDLMARSGTSFTWGREATTTYNESYAGRGEPYSRMDYGEFSPYAEDGTLITPLNTDEFAAPKGSGDAFVQGYNFRLCTTQNKSNMVPWPKPANYNRSDWTLLLKYAAMPINQGKQVPSQGGLGGANHGLVPNGKHDMNNGGLISTDCTGCSWYYPNSTYEERRKIYQQHVDYQQAFLWTLAHDEAIPKPVQDQINSFGLCKDEFTTNNNWPEQLYVREARRMIGDIVFTQNDVLAMRKYSDTNESAGMGSYNFDAHYSHRGPCLPVASQRSLGTEYKVGQGWPGPSACRMLTKDDPPLTLEQKRNNSFVWTGGEGYGGPLDATYELPFSTLLPKREETTNLLCPLTPSASHLALATLRMEPQFMTLGHTAGVAAALAARAAVAVQDVDRAALAATLLAEGQILSAQQLPAQTPHTKAGSVCAHDRCFQSLHAPTANNTCAPKCSPLKANEWLALKQHWHWKPGNRSMTSVESTTLKKSEINSKELPPAERQAVPEGTTIRLTAPPISVDDEYLLVGLLLEQIEVPSVAGNVDTSTTPHWAVAGAPDKAKPLCGFEYAKGRTTTVVYRATEEIGGYNHAAMIDYHDGNLFLTWKNGPRDEDSPSQRVLYAFSADGAKWTETDGRNVLFPRATVQNVTGNEAGIAAKSVPRTLFAGPTVVLNGRRYASASPHQFCLFPYPYSSILTSAEDTNLLMMREVLGDSKGFGPIFWASTKVPAGFEAVSQQHGIQTSGQMDAYVQKDLTLLANRTHLPCDLANGTTKCEACLGTCGSTTKCERTHFDVPSSRGDVILERAGKTFRYSYRADTASASWSASGQTNIPDVGANLNSGTLPDGRVFLINNACPFSSAGGHRDPLVVSTSKDGFSFDTARAVMSCEELGGCKPRIPGRSKDTGPSYPQGVVVTEPPEMAGLYVVATNNKEDVVVVKVPFDSL